MPERDKLSELLYRLREEMPEIGENPVADKMYEIVFEYAKNISEDSVEVVRCKDCVNSAAYPWRPEDCLWCPVNNRPVRVDDFCYEGTKKNLART